MWITPVPFPLRLGTMTAFPPGNANTHAVTPSTGCCRPYTVGIAGKVTQPRGSTSSDSGCPDPPHNVQSSVTSPCRFTADQQLTAIYSSV